MYRSDLSSIRRFYPFGHAADNNAFVYHSTPKLLEENLYCLRVVDFLKQ